MSGPPDRVSVSFEEVAYSTMLQVQALVELLEEKACFTRQEVLERVERLRAATAGEAQSTLVALAESKPWGSATRSLRSA